MVFATLLQLVDVVGVLIGRHRAADLLLLVDGLGLLAPGVCLGDPRLQLQVLLLSYHFDLWPRSAHFLTSARRDRGLDSLILDRLGRLLPFSGGLFAVYMILCLLVVVGDAVDHLAGSCGARTRRLSRSLLLLLLDGRRCRVPILSVQVIHSGSPILLCIEVKATVSTVSVPFSINDGSIGQLLLRLASEHIKFVLACQV